MHWKHRNHINNIISNRVDKGTNAPKGGVVKVGGKNKALKVDRGIHASETIPKRHAKAQKLLAIGASKVRKDNLSVAIGKELIAMARRD
jgi:hypothetical protein